MKNTGLFLVISLLLSILTFMAFTLPDKRASLEINNEPTQLSPESHPGSIWLEEGSCLQCHEQHHYNMHRNLMQTEAGKIQGALWGWGAQTG